MSPDITADIHSFGEARQLKSSIKERLIRDSRSVR